MTIIEEKRVEWVGKVVSFKEVNYPYQSGLFEVVGVVEIDNDLMAQVVPILSPSYFVPFVTSRSSLEIYKP